MSVGEVIFRNGLRLCTYASKWHLDSADYANAVLDYETTMEPSLRESVTAVAQRAWRAVAARGYLRLDVRLDETGLPRVLDVDPNADVSPQMGMHRAVTEAGWSWEQFVRQQVDWAYAGESIDNCQLAISNCKGDRTDMFSLGENDVAIAANP